MSMQFQDRNTQIMQNVAAMLERYRSMLEDICGNIDVMRDSPNANGHTVAQAVEHILSSIRLSDIRTRYLEALSKAKVSANLHRAPESNKQEDIELF